MIVMYSDLDLKGSGYMNITIALANQLASRYERKVTVLGLGYSGAAHDWPFSIIPVKPAQAFQHANAMLQNLVSLGQAGQNEPVDAFVCLLDVPFQEAVFNWQTIGNRIVPFVGVFPIESGPLCATWANVLSRLDARLVISQFGTDQCNDVGLPATHIPIGLDAEAWRMPVEGEVERLRETMGMEPEDFVVLTVADNQERKNLSCAFQAISTVKNKYGIQVKWIVVTRVGSKVGWKIPDLANEHNITDILTTFERGIEHSRLWVLNAMADAFLLTSKAEGLCMPVIEAMACGTPVAVTNATALVEHLKDSDGKARGFPIEAKYVYQDPWGNSYRYFADPNSAAKQLKKIYTLQKRGRLGDIIARGRKYAESRHWDIAGDVLEAAIKDVIELHQERLLAAQESAKTQEVFAGQVNEDETKPLIPPTIPQVVPPMLEKP